MENSQLSKLNSRQLSDYIQILQEQGKTSDEIKTDLLANGVTEGQIITAQSLPPIQQPDKSQMATAKIKKGALWFFGGAIITIITYSMASNSSSGGTYLVAYGPMIYGGILLISGIIDSAGTAERRE